MKKIIVGLVTFLIISSVYAGCNLVPLEVFVDMSREDIIDNINLRFDRIDITSSDLYVHYTMRTIYDEEEGYCLRQMPITTSIGFNLINYCLATYTPEVCIYQLIIREDSYNTIINGEDIIVEPINYQLKQQVSHEIDVIIEMQQEVYNQQLIQQLIGGGNYTLPIIT